jgi:glycosyltransferase involved in cell wall biosynthesis
MRIRLLIATAHVGGGTSRTVSSTASALARRGHEVEIVSVLRRRRRPAFPPDRAVRVLDLVDEYAARRDPEGAGARAAALWRRVGSAAPSVVGHPFDRRTREWSLYTDVQLLRWLRSVGDGVVVGTRPALNLALARYGRSGVVRVGQDHMNLEAYSPWLRRSIRRTYPQLDAVVSLTQRDAADYAALLDGRTRVLSIPNGVPDLHGHRSTLDAPLVVAAGRLTRRKGFDRLLRVWARVAAQRPGWRLHIYGGGEQDAELRALVDRLGTGDSARLMGRTGRLFSRMAEASAFVLTSRREGLPMVVLEAMGVGLPVVAYDCPTGPREVVADGVNGFLVPDGDEDAFAARLLELIDDAEKRRRLGAAALATAAEYDGARLAERWEQLFEELAASKRR